MAIATLIVNPAAGSFRRFEQALPRMKELLASRGFSLEVLETSALLRGTRGKARMAARNSALILACGGDGTVHAVLQGLVGKDVTLGVIPLGTANALARNLKLPLDPALALEHLLSYQPQRIPVGALGTAKLQRFFLVMAGCGPDGALVHGMTEAGRLKARFGRAAYYGHAARLFLTRRWPAFEVEYRMPASQEWQRTTAVAVMCARVPDLGGLFSGLTPRASLMSPNLHVQLLRPPAQLSMAAWFACARTGLPNPWLTTLDVAALRCAPLSAAPVYAQADAEPVGPLPFGLHVLPDALTLLMPPV